MRVTRLLFAILSISQCAWLLPAQTAAQDSGKYEQMEDRLNKLSNALDQTRLELTAAQAEIARLRQEIDSKKNQNSAEETASALASEVARIREDQTVMEEQIKVHEQAKIGTDSRYRVSVNGLLLFNAFSNFGTVDNIDLPSIALPNSEYASKNSTGASMRQTVFGLNAVGPHILGARSLADLSFDFFAEAASTPYDAPSGVVRMHTAHIALDWPRDSLEFGYTGPLISPLSPTSYATVAVPALAWAGNLWMWSPQIRFEQRIPATDTNNLKLEFGLWDPAYNGSFTAPSPRQATQGEASRWPAVESRFSWTAGNSERPYGHVAVGGYRGALKTSTDQTLPAWAVTADAEARFLRYFDLTGEGYRGSSLAGLGGGAYKDTLTGIDPVTGNTLTIGLNAIGGWTQLKLQPRPSFEFNAAIGQDSGYGSDFRRLVLNQTTNSLNPSARDRMIIGNMIFRPKTYILFSPEYRRIVSWQLSGSSYVANVLTLSAGYSF